MEFEAGGKPREPVGEECREREPEMRGLAGLLIANFLNLWRLPYNRHFHLTLPYPGLRPF